jgi:UDP-N-acetylmuramoyl-tripeptide--D-alanyl-D-alanine ligase
MIAMTLKKIADLTSGRVLDPADEDLLVTAFGTDSRQSLTGQLFIALKGADFDGHNFVAAAAEQGASAVLVSSEQTTGIPQVIVPDTLQAIADLARYHRTHFALPTIGLTGSCGKTTTKEMLAAILKESACVHATQGNLNNEFGVPFTLLALEAEHQYSVIEMGAGAPGDIDYLSRIALPDVVLITCIAEAHLERLGSLAGVAETKGGIIHGLSANGTAVLPLDERWLPGWQAKLTARQKLLTFGLTDQADIYAVDVHATATGMQFEIHIGSSQGIVDIQLQGEHNVLNALAAISCCHALDIPLTQCIAGLANIKATSGRLAPMTGINNCQILDDTYNANPAAMIAGANVLSTYPGKHIMVVGDMAELGEEATDIHHRVGQELAEFAIDQLLSVGQLSAHLSRGFGARARHFESKDDLIQCLKPILSADCVVLVKGSRSAGMEDIVKQLMSTDGTAHQSMEAVSC